MGAVSQITVLRVVLLAIHLVLALILGWYLMGLPFLFFELNFWGFLHSGLPAVALPFTAALCFWIVGKIPPFRRRR